MICKAITKERNRKCRNWANESGYCFYHEPVWPQMNRGISGDRAHTINTPRLSEQDYKDMMGT